MESTDSAFPEMMDMNKTKRGALAGAAGGIAAVSALSAFDAVSQHGFEAGAWFSIFTALMGRELSGVTLPDGMLSDMMTARCGMSCGHVLTNRQKTNMRKGKRRGERGE